MTKSSDVSTRRAELQRHLLFLNPSGRDPQASDVDIVLVASLAIFLSSVWCLTSVSAWRGCCQRDLFFFFLTNLSFLPFAVVKQS